MPREYWLPEDMRSKLSKPLGTLFTPAELDTGAFEKAVMDAPLVVTVGDRVTETVGSMGRVPDVQVVDSRENRKDRKPPDVAFDSQIKVRNPAGAITEEAISGIREAFRGTKPVRVLVEGEEDLLAIPVIALAPESTLVLYGQPGEGIVAVVADAEAKKRDKEILSEMGVPEIA